MLFTAAADIFSDLRAARGDGTRERRLLRYTSPELLLIDDLGLRGLRDDEPLDRYDSHSAALRAPGDALCRSCHEAQPQWTEHAHHDAATCVDCHMPTTTYMARDVRHDHRFNPPDPALDQALRIPDACARCHPLDAAKLKLAATWWTPDPATQARTRALAALRADGSTAPAIAALTAETRPSAGHRPWATQSPRPSIRLFRSILFHPMQPVGVTEGNARTFVRIF